MPISVMLRRRRQPSPPPSSILARRANPHTVHVTGNEGNLAQGRNLPVHYCLPNASVQTVHAVLGTHVPQVGVDAMAC